MKIYIRYTILILATVTLVSCRDNNENSQQVIDAQPQVTEQGKKIVFSNDKVISFFKTEKVSGTDVNAEFTAPAKVAAIVVKSQEGVSQNIVLFDNPDLTGNYTQLSHHLINISQIQNINIKQKKTELERIKDLQQHGAATGKDLLDAETAFTMEESNLANEKAALLEHEAALKSGGFDTEALRKSPVGTTYLISELSENQLANIKEGSSCSIQVASYPNEKFTGQIESIGDVIDNTTRMVKLRISINNASGKFKAGMFATVSFSVGEKNGISISQSSLVTVQGKSYVFVKKSPLEFERREVGIGQQIGNRILVNSGLNNGEEVAVEGVLQLKGLSFGY